MECEIFMSPNGEKLSYLYAEKTEQGCRFCCTITDVFNNVSQFKSWNSDPVVAHENAYYLVKRLLYDNYNVVRISDPMIERTSNAASEVYPSVNVYRIKELGEVFHSQDAHIRRAYHSYVFGKCIYFMHYVTCSMYLHVALSRRYCRLRVGGRHVRSE